MSSESVSQRKSFGKNVISVAAFPVGMTAFGATKSVIRNHGIKNAIASLNKEGFTTLKNSLGGDCFSKSLTLADNYREYSRLAKEAKKLQNIVDKGKIPFKDKIFNIFRKNKVTVDTIKEKANAAKGVLEEKNALLASGKQITETGSAIKAGLGQNVGSLVKQGFKDPITWAFTIGGAVLDVINNVIPTFKEKGFGAGMKEMGKTVLKSAADMGTYVASGALGRVIGSAIGTFFCPGGGSMVGGNIGSMVAVSLSNIFVGKIFKSKKEAQPVAQQSPASNNAVPQRNIYA